MGAGFSLEWLALREPFDAAARNRDVMQRLRERRRGESTRIVDFGAGTGANFRVLAPRLETSQEWTLLDNDTGLLGRIAPATRSWAERQRYAWRQVDDASARIGGWRLRWRWVDLVQQPAALAPAGADLGCAAALMDLVAPAWFDLLAQAGWPALYFALTYNGVIEWRPAEPFDETVQALLNEHQRRDKGFGPALGPSAPAYMERGLRKLAYTVVNGRSDWCLAPGDRMMQSALLAGWCEALAPLAPGPALARWAERRRGLIEAGESSLRVGHVDLFAYRG